MFVAVSRKTGSRKFPILKTVQNEIKRIVTSDTYPRIGCISISSIFSLKSFFFGLPTFTQSSKMFNAVLCLADEIT